jgi:predicted small secreted protein
VHLAYSSDVLHPFRNGREHYSPNLDLDACIQTASQPLQPALRRKDAAMQRKLTLVLALMALAGTAPVLSGCYTTQGAGQDLQAAGHGLERSADRNTNYRP